MNCHCLAGEKPILTKNAHWKPHCIQMKQQSCIKANYFDEAEFSDLKKKVYIGNLILFMYFQSLHSEKSERNLKLAFFGLWTKTIWELKPVLHK